MSKCAVYSFFICNISTAAHVVEPMLPGTRDSYINLGKFYDDQRLEKRRSELSELTARYKLAYRTAYKYLLAAGAVSPANSASASEKSIVNAVDNCIALLPQTASGVGRARRFFMDAFSRTGYISLLNTLSDWKIYSITADFGDGSEILKRLGTILENTSYSPVYCPSPLEPDKVQNLLLPCLKIAFTLFRTDNSTCAAALTRTPIDTISENHYTALLASAADMLKSAGSFHDSLEEIYNPCVDFSGIRTLAEKHINTIL